MRTMLALGISSVFLLTACATPTAYKPADKRGQPGFTETQLTDDRYRIVFTGNSRTDAETVQDYALLRAAELTLERNQEWFRLANREQDKDVRTTTSVGTGIQHGGQTAVFQRCGLLSCETFVSSRPGFSSGGGIATTRSATTYTSQLEIVMGSGDAPNDLETYNAEQLSRALRRMMQAQL